MTIKFGTEVVFSKVNRSAKFDYGSLTVPFFQKESGIPLVLHVLESQKDGSGKVN